ncbi:MAG: efflux RND transporter periplasmic adaptor subunit [Planctomycetota bacterium]
MSKAVWIAVVLGCGGGGAWWLSGDGAAVAAGAAADPSTYTVARGDLDITITENGTLVAKESRKVVPEFRGEGKIVFLLEEGAAVQEGDVVCRCDTSGLEDQVEQQEMDIVQGEAALVTARTELEIQIAENAAEVEKARMTLDLMRQEDEKYRDGVAPQDRRVLEVGIKDAETEFKRAQKRHEDSQRLVEQDFIKRSELEQHAIDLEKATVKLESARQALALQLKYTAPMTLRKNTNAVADAERDLETAEKRARSRLNQREADVLQAEKKIKRLQQQLKDRREDIEKMTLKAPCPGILIYGDPREPWYREQCKVGGMIYGGNTLMTIPDLRVMQVKIEVHEADINKVEVGQPVDVTMDTYPGLQLQGEVSRVANIASSGSPWEPVSEVKKFGVEILLKDTAAQQLKPGISAKARIRIARRDGVLYVPLQCAFLEDGGHRCLVVGPDGPQRRAIEVGMSNDTWIEVRSGLEAGERVLLHNPFLSGAQKGKGKGEGEGKGEGNGEGESDGGAEGGGASGATAVEATATQDGR